MALALTAVDPGSLPHRSRPSPERGGLASRDFATVLSAHERCESGGRFVASQRPTTAAAPAGYGRSQLNTRNHVELLGRMSDARLARLGIGRDDLDAMSARGAAAQDWYAAVVHGRRRAGSAVGDDEALTIAAVTAKEPLVAADLDALAQRLGARFQAATGLPPSELRFLAATRTLASRQVAAEYRSERAAGRGRTQALDAVTERHPALRLVRDRVGDAWTARYFSDHRLNENRAAWYTRAAMSEVQPFERLLQALAAGGDRASASTMMAEHLRRALGVVSSLGGFAELPETERLALVGEMARLHALSPVVFEMVLRGLDGLPFADVAALRDRLETLRADPSSSAGAALRAFDRAFGVLV